LKGGAKEEEEVQREESQRGEGRASGDLKEESEYLRDSKSLSAELDIISTELTQVIDIDILGRTSIHS
jgi:hypothetical protein